MQRLEVIQKFIDARKFESYLEIGVNYGKVFLNVKVKRKIGVDPVFRKKFWPSYFYHKLFKSAFGKMLVRQVTSDVYFEKYAAEDLTNGVDIVFVDGMHEHSYAFRDVENALRYLNKGGVIILHDCNPKSKESTVSFEEWAANQRRFVWNGDVWKAIVLLRSTRPDLEIFVADTDFGLGIVTKGVQQTLPYSKEQVQKMEYADLDNTREYLINLRSVPYLEEMIASL